MFTPRVPALIAIAVSQFVAAHGAAIDSAAGLHWGLNYAFVDLGQGFAQSLAVDINDKGQVLIYDPGARSTHVRNPDGSTIKLKVKGPGGVPEAIEGKAINNAGHVCGVFHLPSGVQRAFYYDGEAVTFPGTLGGESSGALGLNNGDVVVGWSQTAGSGNDAKDPSATALAFAWSPGKPMRCLKFLGPGVSRALRVNSRGDILGLSGSEPFL